MIEKEKYLRLAADFENFKHREAQEKVELSRFGSRLVITDMLDVLDRLERAIENAPPNLHEEWFKGLKQVHRQFEAAIQKSGATKIETKNKSFDPHTMEAVQMVEGGESHQVKEEVRAGYLMHERVIRPARVIIYE